MVVVAVLNPTEVVTEATRVVEVIETLVIPVLVVVGILLMKEMLG